MKFWNWDPKIIWSQVAEYPIFFFKITPPYSVRSELSLVPFTFRRSGYRTDVPKVLILISKKNPNVVELFDIEKEDYRNFDFEKPQNGSLKALCSQYNYC